MPILHLSLSKAVIEKNFPKAEIISIKVILLVSISNREPVILMKGL